MDKALNLSWKAKEPSCSFCYLPSNEIRLILKIMLKQFKKMQKDKKYIDLPIGTQ